MAQTSVLTQIPENTNFLQPTKFTFTIPGIPFANYFCQSIIFPSISTTEALQPTPFSDAYRYGDKLVFDPLTITFLVDEDFRVWEETFQWLSYLTNPARFKEFEPRFSSRYYDGILTFNTNSNVPNLRIKFLNCHPTSLGSIQLSSSDSALVTPFADLTIRYDRFIFERL